MLDQSIKKITNVNPRSNQTPSSTPPKSPSTPPVASTSTSQPNPTHNPTSFIDRRVTAPDGATLQLSMEPGPDGTIITN